MINIDIAKSAGGKISQFFIRKIVRKTLFLSNKKINNLSLSVVFVGKKKIQALNRLYRKKNEATDILSFNYSSGYNKKGIEGLPASLREALLAGELFLCPEIIEKSAKEKNVSFQKELAFVLSHGILHLLGFRHGRRMHKIQDDILYELRI